PFGVRQRAAAFVSAEQAPPTNPGPAPGARSDPRSGTRACPDNGGAIPVGGPSLPRAAARPSDPTSRPLRAGSSSESELPDDESGGEPPHSRYLPPGRHLGQRLDDRLVELRQVTRHARGDQVAIDHQRLVDVLRTGVLDV